jgi:hypothetical protein
MLDPSFEFVVANTLLYVPRKYLVHQLSHNFNTVVKAVPLLRSGVGG